MSITYFRFQKILIQVSGRSPFSLWGWRRGNPAYDGDLVLDFQERKSARNLKMYFVQGTTLKTSVMIGVKINKGYSV